MQQVILPIELIVQLMLDAFSRGEAYELTVTGTSMSPTLQPMRDRVRLVSPKQRLWRRGDILFALPSAGIYTLHRAIRIAADGTITLNGDGQVWTETAAPGEVIAVVDAIRRKGKWISVRNPIYRMYVFLWSFTRPSREILVKIKKKLKGQRKG